jgi:hypothetical protein
MDFFQKLTGKKTPAAAAAATPAVAVSLNNNDLRVENLGKAGAVATFALRNITLSKNVIGLIKDLGGEIAELRFEVADKEPAGLGRQLAWFLGEIYKKIAADKVTKVTVKFNGVTMGQSSRIVEMFAGISQFPNVQSLEVAGDIGLTEMPSDIFDMANLTSLKISGSPGLTTLPKDVCKLQRLQTLDIDSLQYYPTDAELATCSATTKAAIDQHKTDNFGMASAAMMGGRRGPKRTRRRRSTGFSMRKPGRRTRSRWGFPSTRRMARRLLYRPIRW